MSRHIVGHTLDLVITRSSEQFISEIRTYKLTASDHYFVKFGLPVSKHRPERKLIEFKTLNKIYYTSFRNDLNCLIGSTSPVDNVESLVAIYNKGLKATLDNHAPLKQKYITVRPYNPLYDDEIHMAKLANRKAEKLARTSGFTVYEEIHTFHRNLVNRLLDKKKQHFFREKVTESKSDYKCVFKLLN